MPSALSLNILALTSTVFVALVFYFFLTVVYGARDPIWTYNLVKYGHIVEYPRTTQMQELGFLTLALLHFLCWLLVVFSLLLITYWVGLLQS